MANRSKRFSGDEASFSIRHDGFSERSALCFRASRHDGLAHSSRKQRNGLCTLQSSRFGPFHRSSAQRVCRGKARSVWFCTLLVGSMAGWPLHTQERETRPRFGISTTAVVVDVVVRDRKSVPVSGLTIPEFEVYEDGIRQSITSLEELVWPPRTSPMSSAASPPPSSAESAQRSATGMAPIVVALVFEELGPSSLRLATSAAFKFTVESLAPETYVAVFGLDRAIHTLSPYTDDRAVLSKALQAVGLHPGRPLERAGDVPSAEHGSALPGQPVRSTAEENQFIRGHATLSGLEAVVQSMASFQGRKAIVLFSEGLALGADPRGAGTPDSGIADNRWEHLLRVVDRANKNYIAFYTFDAGGLRAQNPSAAAKYSMRLSPFGVEPYVGLETIARETGGRYFGNTNDLARGLNSMTEDLRHYYLLAYSPTNLRTTGEYRKIEVKVTRRGVSVVHRRGYRATNDMSR